MNLSTRLINDKVNLNGMIKSNSVEQKRFNCN